MLLTRQPRYDGYQLLIVLANKNVSFIIPLGNTILQNDWIIFAFMCLFILLFPFYLLAQQKMIFLFAYASLRMIRNLFRILKTNQIQDDCFSQVIV